MPWPQSIDYNLAIQNPHLCFQDPDLRACTAWSADPILGLPTPRPGNFADVYEMIHPDGPTWAVKCFTLEVEDRHDRYAAISDYLGRIQRSFIVEFRYIDQGILVNGGWYPILKMRWVAGKTLNEFVREQIDKPAVFDKLATMWLKLAQELRELKIGHGDLQHGNVLLVPNPQKGTFHLRLIDYDGMYVPALANRPSRESGFPGFQHPQRARKNLFGPEVDRFSHLVIYTALRALRAGGSKLWNAFGTPENLLFSETDFTHPGKSDLWRVLFALPDTELRHLLGHLLLAALNPAEAVPLLDDIVPDGVPRRLGVAEVERLYQEAGPLLGTRRSKLAGRTPPPRMDDLPALPGAINQVPAQPAARIVPEARRLDNSLPEWMLPEAVPLEDTIIRHIPRDDMVARPEQPAVPREEEQPVFKMVLVPLAPVESPPPLGLRLTPVLVESSDGPTIPPPLETPEVPEPPEPLEALPVENDDIDDIDDVEPLDVVELVPVEKSAQKPSAVPAAPRPNQAEPPPGNRSTLGLFLVGVLLIACLAVIVVLVVRLRREPQPVPPRPLLQLQGEVALEGGQELHLPLRLRRNNTEGPYEIRLLELPREVELRTLNSLEPRTEEEDVLTATYALQARLDVPDSVTTIRIQVLRLGDVVTEQPVRLTLSRPKLPVLIPPTTTIRVETVAYPRLEFAVDRRGRSERLTIELLDLPAGIRQESRDAGPGTPTLSVILTLPPGKAQGPALVTARLLLDPTTGGQRFEVHQARVTLDFTSPRSVREFLIPPKEEVRLTAGGTANLTVEVDRNVYRSPVRLALRKPPPGVTATEIEIPASEGRGAIRLFASPDILPPAEAAVVDIVALEGTEEIRRVSARIRLLPPG